MDSDEDGVPNGVELGDPDGVWMEGDANPGDSTLITNPGDPDSFSDIGPTSPGDAWIAVLAGEKVVPSVDTQARGSAIFKLHEPEKILMYFLNVFEIQNITAAHIHIGDADVNGGVVHPLDAPVDGFSSGSLNLTDEDIANMKAGLFYVQVHTQANPAGEIRGQIDDEPLLFSATLNSSQVVDSAIHSAGTGSMEILLDEDLNRISYTLTVMNLEGVTMAHIHEGMRGVNGGVVIPLASESFETISGEAEVKEEILRQMLTEGLYVNVHTEQNPGGEIRGQITLNAFMDQPSNVIDWTMYE
ncbi:MAG: CHRD domain-containing protein [Candidatus Omnitrophica bacterium]|nr:CHRD domain-containing protein [Candidatus Omnitrophota bacterium]